MFLVNGEQKSPGPLDKVMVNTIQNVETRSQTVAGGKDAAQPTTARKIEIENGEGRLLRARRNRPLSLDNTTNNHQQINTYFPVLQCKLPLDRIEDILSRIKKTESSTIDKSDNVKSDLSVQTELNSISTNSDLINSDVMTNISGNTSDVVELNKNAPIRIMCLFCDRTFVSNKLLQKHTERSHHISSNRRCSTRNVEQTPSVNFHPGCNFCSKNSNIQTATNLSVLFNHLLDEHAVKYFACRKCKIRFSTNELLESHNRDEHGINLKNMEISLDNRVSEFYDNTDIGKCTRSSNYSNIEKNSPSPLFSSQFSSNVQFVQSKFKTVNSDCLLLNSNENASIESSDELKMERKPKNIIKKSTKSRASGVISNSQKEKNIKLSPVKDSRSISEKSRSTDVDFVDFEDNIAASLIIPQKKSTDNSISNKKINIDQNAVIILDDINYDNKLFKNKQSIVSNQMNLKSDDKDNQILSRLGIAQNRTSRARSLRRSRKTPLTENRSCSETPRKDKTKVKCDVTDFVINKNKNDPNSKFDPDFYSNVSANVRENIMKYLDGKLGKQNESALIHDIVDPKIKSTHAVIPSPQPAEIHGSDVSLNAITIFPTLLTSDQYGSDKVPHYSYGANAQTFKKIITKNSWKWKWDPIKKYKYCNEDGKIVRKIRPLQHISPRDLSKLDIWTQLTMREKFDQFMNCPQSDSDINTERASRNERQKQINELNMILDKRSFPDIESESKRCCSLPNDNNDDEPSTTSDVQEQSDVILNDCTENKSLTNSEVSDSDYSILNNLELVKKPSENTAPSNSVLSGEWARPRCYICCICGRRADCLRLLEAHQASHHLHANATYYEIVGQELLDTEVYKYLYLPGAKVNQDKGFKTHSKNDSNLRNLKKLSQSPIALNRSSRILRTTTRSIKSLEKECTKCKKMLAPSEFYRHILECAGDYGWMMAKKKCKYKPFGARRRRLKGLYKREVPQEEERTEIRDQTVRPKIPPRPRIKPSDAETIQRMLANLPPKRASRQIHDLSTPKSKTIVRDRKQHTAHQIHNSKTNLTRSKISAGSSITSVKNSLAKKVIRLTRSVSNMKHPNLETQKRESSMKEPAVKSAENSDRKSSNVRSNKKVENDQSSIIENDSLSSSEQKDTIKSSNAKQCLIDVPSNKLPNLSKKVNLLNVNSNSKPLRNRGNVSKNDVSPAVSENVDVESDTISENIPQKLTRRTVISSKIINTPMKNLHKLKSNLLKPSQKVDSDLSVVSPANEESQKQKKSKKKCLTGLPLKWMGNKKVHFSKSKKALKKKLCVDVATACENSDINESFEIQKNTSECITVEKAKTSVNVDVQCDPEELDKILDSVVDSSSVPLDQSTPIKDNIQKEKSIVVTADEMDNPNKELLDTENSALANISITTCSNFNHSQNRFSFDNNSSNENSSRRNTDQFNNYGKNSTTRIINSSTPGHKSRSESFYITNLTDTKKEKSVEDKLIEPIRSPNSAYIVKNANIDKPPLLYNTQNCYNVNQYKMCVNAQSSVNYDTMKGLVPSPSTCDSDNSLSKIANKCKQPKSRKGLNDCIAMLKGKLVEKTNIPEVPTPPLIDTLSNVVDEIPQPLDLSGRIPQPEDLSMKSNVSPVIPQPPPAKNITPPKPLTKPIYDPILKIPQFSPSTANQRILSKSRSSLNNAKAQQSDVKKTKSDFSIPSLLSPNKKVSQQNEIPKKTNVIEIPHIRPDITIFPKSFTDTIDKLSVTQINEIANALPESITLHTEYLKNMNTSEAVPKPDFKQLKMHFIENILSSKSSLSKEAPNVKPLPIMSEVSPCMDKKTTVRNEIPLAEPKIPDVEKPNAKSPALDYISVDTDLFLIDPVTGMITKRNSTSPVECVATETSKIVSKETESTPCNAKSDIIDLTSNVLEKNNENIPCTSVNKEISNIDASTCVENTEKISKNLRSVRIKSAVDKFNLRPLEYSDSIEFESEKNSTEDFASQVSQLTDTPADDVKILDGVIVESTTSSVKEKSSKPSGSESRENINISDQPLEPAIQQDEVSSTQHSAIDDSSNSLPSESLCSKENEITNSEIVLDKPNENKAQKSSKSANKAKSAKAQSIDNKFILDQKEVITDKSKVDSPKKWGRRKSNKKVEILKTKNSSLLTEEIKTNVGCEISSSNKSKHKQNLIGPQENVKISNEKAEIIENSPSDDQIINVQSLTKYKNRHLPVNSLRDLSEKTNTENLQQLSLKLIDQNIISEFALTPTNISELKTNDEDGRIENSNTLIISNKNKFKNKDITKDTNEVKNMAKALVEKKVPQNNPIEAYSTGDSIESSILTGEEGKTSQSEYPIASPIRTCSIDISSECLPSHNIPILSGNEESDDDICLAEMAKKRSESIFTINERKSDIPIEPIKIKVSNSEDNMSVRPSQKNVKTKSAQDKKEDLKQKRKLKSNKVSSFTSDDVEVEDKNLRSKTRSVTKAENISIQKDLNISLKVPDYEIETKPLEENTETNVKSIEIKKGKNKSDAVSDIPVTRKSDRLSFTRNDNVEKINTINSVKLSENGHLIFKLQKESENPKTNESIFSDFNDSSISSNSVSNSKNIFEYETSIETSIPDCKVNNELLQTKLTSCAVEKEKIIDENISAESLKKQNTKKLAPSKTSQSKPRKSKYKQNVLDLNDHSSISENISVDDLQIPNKISEENVREVFMTTNKTSIGNEETPFKCSENLKASDDSTIEAKTSDSLVKLSNDFETISSADYEGILKPLNNTTENVNNIEKVDAENSTIVTKKKSKTNKTKTNLLISDEIERNVIEKSSTEENFVGEQCSAKITENYQYSDADMITSKIIDDTSLHKNEQFDNTVDLSKNKESMQQPHITANNYDLRKLHKVKKIDNRNNSPNTKHSNNKNVSKLSEAFEENIPLVEISKIYKDIKNDKGKTNKESILKIFSIDEKQQSSKTVNTNISNKNKSTKELKSKKKQMRKRYASSSSSEDNVLSTFISREPSLDTLKSNVVATSTNATEKDVEIEEPTVLCHKIKLKRGRKQRNTDPELKLSFSASSQQSLDVQSLYSENNNKALNSNLFNVDKNESNIQPKSTKNQLVIDTATVIDSESAENVMTCKESVVCNDPVENINIIAPVKENDASIESITEKDNIVSVKVNENKSLTETISKPKDELKLNLKIHHKKKKNSRKNENKDVSINAEYKISETFNDSNITAEETDNSEIYYSVNDNPQFNIHNESKNTVNSITAEETLDTESQVKSITQSKKKKKKKSDHEKIVTNENTADDPNTFVSYCLKITSKERKRKNKSNVVTCELNNDCENVAISNSSIPEIDPYNFDMDQKEMKIEPKKPLIKNIDRIENRRSKSKRDSMSSFFENELVDVPPETKSKSRNIGSYLKSITLASSKDDSKINSNKSDKYDHFTPDIKKLSDSPTMLNTRNTTKNKIKEKLIPQSNIYNNVEEDSISENNLISDTQFDEKISENCEGSKSGNIVSITIRNKDSSEDHKKSNNIIIDMNNLKVSKKNKKKNKSKSNSSIYEISTGDVHSSSQSILSDELSHIETHFDSDSINSAKTLETRNKSKCDSDIAEERCDISRSTVDFFQSNVEQPTNNSSSFKKFSPTVADNADNRDERLEPDTKPFSNFEESSLQSSLIDTTLSDSDTSSKNKTRKCKNINSEKKSLPKNKKSRKEQSSPIQNNEKMLQDNSSKTLIAESNFDILSSSINSSIIVEKNDSLSDVSSKLSEFETNVSTHSFANPETSSLKNKILPNSIETIEADDMKINKNKSILSVKELSKDYNEDLSIPKSSKIVIEELNKSSIETNIEDNDLNESDKASLIQDKYLADFGMYTEKRPRKSTILAIKKISQTFKPDSSDTDDVNENGNNSIPRQNIKSLKKKSKKLTSDPQIINDSLDVEEPSVTVVQDESIEKSKSETDNIVNDPKNSQLNDMSYEDQKYQEFKADTYCSICKRKFRRPENLLKHKTTLMHISKLSEIEAQEMKNKVEFDITPSIKVQVNSNYLSKETPSNNERVLDVVVDKDDEIVKPVQLDTISSRPYKNLAERKSFDLEVFLNTTPPVGFVQPDVGIESTGRKELSRDEALFFECCSLLKESDAPRKNITESNLFKSSKLSDKSVEIDIKQKSRNEPIVLHNVDVENVSETSDIPTFASKDQQFETSSLNVLKACNKKIGKDRQSPDVLYQSSSKVLNVYESQISSNMLNEPNINDVGAISYVNNYLESIGTSSYQEEPLVIQTNSTDFSDIGDGLLSDKNMKHSKSLKNHRKGLESINKRNIKDQDDSMTNTEHSPGHFDDIVPFNDDLANSDIALKKSFSPGDVNSSNHDLQNNSDSSSKKNNISNVKLGSSFSQIIEFEDKFDKIKRKAREKAQQAQEALSASMSPNVYTKSKKKTHSKSRKLSKSSDTSSKNSKISKNRRIPKKKTHTKEFHKFENKKILTKGALKGFEGIKVSIPTQEINLNILETAKSNLQDLVDYALLDENVSRTSDNENDLSNTSKDAYSKSSEKDFYTKYKNQNHTPEYKNTKSNSIITRDSQIQQQSDIYDFFDDDDEDDNPRKSIKFLSPSNISSNEKSISTKKVNDSGDKIPGDVHNEDSQISSLSFSDRDDFNYLSEDYNANQSEDDTNSKSSNSNEILLTNMNKSNRKSKMFKNKKITKKSAIMGRIFKNNAIRNEQKLLNNDQLFDSLLEKSSATNIRNASKASGKLLEYSDSINFSDNPNTNCEKLDNIDNTPLSEPLSDFDSDIEEKSRSPIRTHQRKIMPRLKARSSDDETLDLKDTSDKTDSAILLETYQDNIGVASRKLQRKCTTGKQNVLAESWSSESDFEDFRQFEEYSSIPKPQRHHRRPRRSRRHRYPSEHKILENQNIEPDNDNNQSFIQDSLNASDDYHDKFFDDNLDNEDFPNQTYKICDDLSIRKESDNELEKTFEDGSLESKNARMKTKRLMFTKRRVSFNNSTNLKNADGRKRRKQSQKPFDYDDEFKPTRIAEPLTTQKRNKRTASDKLYIWPSSSDEEIPNVTADTPSRGPEPIEQHGWIVGDSHKKLVTMLAHAKGRKLDDNATVKEKKTRLQS